MPTDVQGPMSGGQAGKIQVYAVIRIEAELTDPEQAVSVTEILPTIEQAEAEVARLNRVNAAKGCRYVWQATRYFTGGREVSDS